MPVFIIIITIVCSCLLHLFTQKGSIQMRAFIIIITILCSCLRLPGQEVYKCLLLSLSQSSYFLNFFFLAFESGSAGLKFSRYPRPTAIKNHVRHTNVPVGNKHDSLSVIRITPLSSAFTLYLPFSSANLQQYSTLIFWHIRICSLRFS